MSEECQNCKVLQSTIDRVAGYLVKEMADNYRLEQELEVARKRLDVFDRANAIIAKQQQPFMWKE